MGCSPRGRRSPSRVWTKRAQKTGLCGWFYRFGSKPGGPFSAPQAAPGQDGRGKLPPTGPGFRVRGEGGVGEAAAPSENQTACKSTITMSICPIDNHNSVSSTPGFRVRTGVGGGGARPRLRRHHPEAGQHGGGPPLRAKRGRRPSGRVTGGVHAPFPSRFRPRGAREAAQGRLGAGVFVRSFIRHKGGPTSVTGQDPGGPGQARGRAPRTP